MGAETPMRRKQLRFAVKFFRYKVSTDKITALTVLIAIRHLHINSKTFLSGLTESKVPYQYKHLYITSGLRNTMKTLVIHNIGNDAGLHVL